MMSAAFTRRPSQRNVQYPPTQGTAREGLYRECGDELAARCDGAGGEMGRPRRRGAARRGASLAAGTWTSGWGTTRSDRGASYGLVNCISQRAWLHRPGSRTRAEAPASQAALTTSTASPRRLTRAGARPARWLDELLPPRSTAPARLPQCEGGSKRDNGVAVGVAALANVDPLGGLRAPSVAVMVQPHASSPYHGG